MNMNENSVQKCRTCLKSSSRTFSLTKNATGLNPRSTYGQLLKDYAKLNCNEDYEHLMPQFLCILCCRTLRNSYAFIKQAQYCNDKLIIAISKQLDSLQENIIDIPENKVGINMESDGECHSLLQKVRNNTKIGYHLKCAHVKELRNNVTSDHNEKTSNTTCEITDISQSQLKDSSTANKNNKINANSKTNADEAITGETCPICGKIMRRHDNLIKHMRAQHDIQNPSKLFQKPKDQEFKVFNCDTCSSKYTNKYSYLYHLKHTHSIADKKGNERQKDKVIKCRSCEYTARTYAALNYHNRSRHGTEKDKFKCNFCSHFYFKKFDLLTHVKNCHKELIKTLKAEMENKGKTVIDTAILQPDNSKDATDPSSDDNIPLIKLNSKSQLPFNSNNKLEVDSEHFSDEEFIRNMLNIKKRQTKSSTKSFARRCDECGNIYKNYRALYAHQRHVHISEDKYSLCPHCGKKYKRRTDLRIHMEKAHTSKSSSEITKQPAKVREKRFMCTQCSYCTTTITILNIHINRHHTGEKPYKCDICFKCFIIPYDLKIHRYLHTGERPYKCPICSKGFRDNSHMIKHKGIHSSERAYKCKECPKSFSQSYNLSVHKRTHLKQKNLYCNICGKVFENRSLLNIHRINENHHDEIL